MVEREPSKFVAPVRFRHPAPQGYFLFDKSNNVAQKRQIQRSVNLRYFTQHNKATMETLRNSQEKIPDWVRPDFQKEKGELERVTRDFLLREPNTQNIRQVVEALKGSPTIEFSDTDWEQLENTDSFHNVGLGQIEEARKICNGYNEELEEENKRNFDVLLEGFHQGNKMECPVILKNSEGKMHLVSGNTRLMIARALGIRPRVIIGDIA